MSKLYALNRMRGAPAAGDLLTTGLKIGGSILKGLGGLFKSKAAKAAAAAAKKALSSQVGQTALGVGGVMAVDAILSKAPGGGGGGSTGHWTRRRRKGITGAELKGFHKVARLLHKEGMAIKHHRRSK